MSLFKYVFTKEFEKNWEESRQGRVDSWMTFTKAARQAARDEEETGKIKKKKEKKDKKFSPIGFRPPKPKPESR